MWRQIAQRVGRRVHHRAALGPGLSRGSAGTRFAPGIGFSQRSKALQGGGVSSAVGSRFQGGGHQVGAGARRLQWLSNAETPLFRFGPFWRRGSTGGGLDAHPEPRVDLGGSLLHPATPSLPPVFSFPVPSLVEPATMANCTRLWRRRKRRLEWSAGGGQPGDGASEQQAPLDHTGPGAYHCDRLGPHQSWSQLRKLGIIPICLI